VGQTGRENVANVVLKQTELENRFLRKLSLVLRFLKE